MKPMNYLESQYTHLTRFTYIIKHKQRGKIIYIMLYFMLHCIEFCQDRDMLFLFIIYIVF